MSFNKADWTIRLQIVLRIEQLLLDLHSHPIIKKSYFRAVQEAFNFSILFVFVISAFTWEASFYQMCSNRVNLIISRSGWQKRQLPATLATLLLI